MPPKARVRKPLPRYENIAIFHRCDRQRYAKDFEEEVNRVIVFEGQRTDRNDHYVPQASVMFTRVYDGYVAHKVQYLGLHKAACHDESGKRKGALFEFLLGERVTTKFKIPSDYRRFLTAKTCDMLRVGCMPMLTGNNTTGIKTGIAPFTTFTKLPSLTVENFDGLFRDRDSFVELSDLREKLAESTEAQLACQLELNKARAKLVESRERTTDTDRRFKEFSEYLGEFERAFKRQRVST